MPPSFLIACASLIFAFKAEAFALNVVNSTIPGSERFPAASYAVTLMVYCVPRRRSFISTPVPSVTSARTVPPFFTSYPATPTLSVEGFQLIHAVVCPTGSAFTLSGIDGASSSFNSRVVKVTLPGSDSFPAASYAMISMVYAVWGFSPVNE